MSKRPAMYAKIPNVTAAIAANPAASPSSPSVRFTAFDEPDTTTPVNRINDQTANLAWTSEKKGTAVAVDACGEIWLNTRNAPRARPKLHWPIILYLATNPRVFPCTTLR